MIKGLLSENIAVLGTIDPDAYIDGIYGATTYYSDWVDMKVFNQVLGVVMVGAMAAGAKVDAKLQEATNSSGAGAQDLTGKAITQLTQAGSDDDKQALINMRADELSNGYTHVRLALTVTAEDVDAAALLLGGQARYLPANNFDLASVDEIVT